MSTLSSLKLPYGQTGEYWLCIALKSARTENLRVPLERMGLTPVEAQEGLFAMQVSRNSHAIWRRIRATLEDAGSEFSAAIMPGDEPCNVASIVPALKSAPEIERVLSNLWLIDTLIAQPMSCYFQSIVHEDGKVEGYESLVRLRGPAGEIITGDRIMEASAALGIHHSIDRYLHGAAVQAFTEAGLSGRLFVNFIPGFVRKPSIYLEGLTDAVREYKFDPKNIVLDITQGQTLKDLSHVRRIIAFCQEQGFGVALDGIASLETARKIIPDIQASVVKLDRMLSAALATSEHANRLARFVEFAHRHHCLVLAEGIETVEMFDAMRACGVDLFQGYYFSYPSPATYFTSK
ncbi:MAG: EAL domain-containing protein [Alphaproteobacteria bacterium]|nr:EAL domain-containing protein [Alphaproteobacteria bacterium]